MRVIEKTVFSYSELSESAQERARNWWRGVNAHDDFFAESIIEDAKNIAAIIGWEIKRIGYSGFSYQGDGAHFVGHMGYAKGCAKAVKAYAPQDTELHQISAAWQELQRKNFYALSATVAHNGRYQHEYCTVFDCRDSRQQHGYFDNQETEDSIKEIGRDFMRWIYRQLEREYEYQNSDNMVAEMLQFYEFYENGDIV